MLKLEISIVALFLITLLMIYSNMPGSHAIFITSGSLAAVFYLISGFEFRRRTIAGFAEANFESTRSNRLIKISAGIAFAFAFMTFVFNEMFWRSFVEDAYIAVVLLSLVLLLSMIYLETKDPVIHRYILIRYLIFTSALLFYVLAPLESRLEWKYNDQYYREILLYSIENPNDKDAGEMVIEYRRRMNGQAPLDDTTVD